ncbi:glycosyltransferase [uncultured Kocuria sp.]|uniref:glycosyltransferase n=1 Tax=uncultured Kocuria sp. TaxID=259305 RepID=UPI00261DE076|nr:glycosyltransferase [uncultured Kocuria sp.]
MLTAVERVVVVVPVRNEERLLGRCLATVEHAATRARGARPPVRVDVVVALDRCTDGSARIAAAAGADVVVGAWGTAGAARAAAVLAAGAAGERTWIVSTDADSAVPAHWLTGHLDAAGSGAELVLGTVEPDPRDLAPGVLERWHALHRLEEGHPHVHAANLGVRADVYAACGGFRPVPHGEDVGLAETARAHGHRVLATDRVRVLTSGRSTGRAERGFAGYLRALAGERHALGAGPL